MIKTNLRLAASFDVGVLFFNRMHQTFDCIDSFLNEEVQPNIVVLDQGSAAEQRKLLADALVHQTNVRFVTLAENIGVGPGRNRLCRECSSNWILFVDNDTVLNTPGGVRLINSAIEQAKDIDGLFPRILNVHENRYMDRLRIAGNKQHLRCEIIGSDVPTTNIFSGCAVIMRRAVLLGQPYDERYFLGFEDFELALRAFTVGRPLLLRSVDNVTFVHKHMPVMGEPDVASTQLRYSSPHIAKGFEVLKNQYGCVDLLAGWEQWTTKQREEMIVSRPVAPRIVHDPINLTFVVDFPNSALDCIVRTLTRDMPTTHLLTTVYAHKTDDLGQTLRLILESFPDVIHFMWRPDFSSYIGAASVKKCAAQMRLNEAEVLDRLCQSQFTFSVGDYLFLEHEAISAFRPLYWLADGYCVTSRKLFDIYARIPGYPKPSALISNDINSALFDPAASARRAKSSIRVGLIRNSPLDEDVFGLNMIIYPCIEALRSQGVDVELVIVDGVERTALQEDVAALYREMDIYVCASQAEHSALPSEMLLGAMASGIPVITTRWGVAPYIFGIQQQQFIVERSVEAFSTALRRLCSDMDLRVSLARENLQQTANRNWTSCVAMWQCFFADVIRRTKPDTPNWRRFIIEKFFLRAEYN